jgi:hypothetical protein
MESFEILIINTLEYLVFDFKILFFLFLTWFSLFFGTAFEIMQEEKFFLFAGRGLEFSEEVRESHGDQQSVHHSTEQPSGQPAQVPYPSSISNKCRIDQCSGSTGTTCFWVSRIRTHLSEVWIRIRILLSSYKNSKKNLDSYYFVTLSDFLSLKNDVNVPSKSTVISRKIVFKN